MTRSIIEVTPSHRGLWRLVGLGGAALLTSFGCGDDRAAERIRAARLAEGCSINSDCQDLLVCVFQRCHIECEEDRDCEEALRCVRGDVEGVNVCQLPDEVECERHTDCPGKQVCAVDAECRDACGDDQDCTPTQVCAASNECASTVAGKDSLDEDGNIIGGGARGGTGGSGATGDGGVPGGLGGESGNDGEQGGSANGATGGTRGGSGGRGGMSGMSGGGTSGGGTSGGGMGGTSGGGMGGASGGGMSGGGMGGASGGGMGGGGMGGASGGGMGGAGGTGGAPTGHHETSDGVETVDNNDRYHAVPLSVPASIYLPDGDADWFSIQTPDDGRAHIIDLTIQQQAGVGTWLVARAGADFSQLGITRFPAGVTSWVYMSVGPASTTLLEFYPETGSTLGRLDLSAVVTSEADDHEPNNLRTTASPIQVNTEVSAQLAIPYNSTVDRAADDWYSVDLVQGTGTVRLLSVPDDPRIQIERVTAQGAIQIVVTTTAGLTGDFTFAVPATGTYFLHFAPFGSSSTTVFYTPLKPQSLYVPYVFQVLQ